MTVAAIVECWISTLFQHCINVIRVCWEIRRFDPQEPPTVRPHRVHQFHHAWRPSAREVTLTGLCAANQEASQPITSERVTAVGLHKWSRPYLYQSITSKKARCVELSALRFTNIRHGREPLLFASASAATGADPNHHQPRWVDNEIAILLYKAVSPTSTEHCFNVSCLLGMR